VKKSLAAAIWWQLESNTFGRLVENSFLLASHNFSRISLDSESILKQVQDRAQNDRIRCYEKRKYITSYFTVRKGGARKGYQYESDLTWSN